MIKKLTLAILLFLLPICAEATTYYVDATDGNDSNDGTTAAWKTINRVNTAFSAGTFANGDTLAFQNGETFSGYRLVSSSTYKIPANFTITNYATIGSGVGVDAGANNPIIDGNTPVNSTSTAATARTLWYLYGSSNLTVSNLQFKGQQHYSVTYCYTCDPKRTAVGRLLAIYYVNGVTVHHLNIDGLPGTHAEEPDDMLGCFGIYLYNCSGNTAIYSNTIKNLGPDKDGGFLGTDASSDPAVMVPKEGGDCAGIMIDCTKGMDGVNEIYNNTVYNVNADCLQISNPVAYGSSLNWQVHNNNFYNAGEDCIDLKGSEYVNIYNNQLHREATFIGYGGSSHNYGSGIMIHQCATGKPASNINIHDNPTFQNLDTTDTNTYGIAVSNVTASGYTTDTVTVRNNCIDGWATGVKVYSPTGTYSTNINLIYNKIINFTTYGIWYGKTTTGVVSGSAYHNTVYAGSPAVSSNGLRLQYIGSTDSVTVKDNIFYLNKNDSTVYPLYVYGCTDLTKITVDYNDWYNPSHTNRVYYNAVGTTYSSTQLADWNTAKAGHDTFSDPTFTTPGSDFTITSGPCIDTGINLGYTPDFAGTTVPLNGGSSATDDMGAYEYDAPPAGPKIYSTYVDFPLSVKSSGGDAATISAAEGIFSQDFTKVTSTDDNLMLVFSGTPTEDGGVNIDDGDTVTLYRDTGGGYVSFPVAGAYTATVIHHTANQICVKGVSAANYPAGGFLANDRWRVDANDYFTVSDAGNAVHPIIRVDQAFDSTTSITFAGGKYVAAHPLTVTVAPAFRHKGTWPAAGTAYNLIKSNSICVNVYEGNIRFEWLALQVSDASAHGRDVFEIINSDGTENGTVELVNCILKGHGNSSYNQAGIKLNDTTATSKINLLAVNNIIYNLSTRNNVGNCGIYATSCGTVNCYNNTIIGGGYAAVQTVGTLNMYNTIAQGYLGGNAWYYGTVGGDYNVGPTGSNPPGNHDSLGTVSFVNTGAGTEDYHLLASDTVAINKGYNYNSSSGLDTDIDLQKRPDAGGTDIGVDEASNSTYWVDSVNGDDAAKGGTSSSDAWNSLSKALSYASSSGATIEIARGSHFTEDVTIPSASLTLSATGTGDPPVIEGDLDTNAKGSCSINRLVVKDGGIILSGASDSLTYCENYGTGAGVTVSGSGTTLKNCSVNGPIAVGANCTLTNVAALSLTRSTGTITGTYNIFQNTFTAPDEYSDTGSTTYWGRHIGWVNATLGNFYLNCGYAAVSGGHDESLTADIMGVAPDATPNRGSREGCKFNIKLNRW